MIWKITCAPYGSDGPDSRVLVKQTHRTLHGAQAEAGLIPLGARGTSARIRPAWYLRGPIVLL